MSITWTKIKDWIKKHWAKLLVPTALAAGAYGIFGLPNGVLLNPNDSPIAPLVFNGQTINFLCADDNTGEDYLILTDKCSYSSSLQTDMYFAIKNTTAIPQNLFIQMFHDKASDASEIDEFASQSPYDVQVDDYGPLNTTCPSGWVPISTNRYYCGNEKNDQICDVVNGKVCTQNNALLGQHTETRFKDQWLPITKDPNPDHSKNDNSPKKVPPGFALKDQIRYLIPGGETKYFRAKLSLPFNQSGETYIAAYDNSGHQGLLDPSWYSNNWNYRVPITIDHTKVGTSTAITGFPVLFSTTTLTTLKTTANGGHMGRSDGLDIVMTAADGTTVLPYEMEKYSSTTGETIAWFQTSTSTALSTTTDTTYYMYYGNSSASDQSNKTAVWDSDFIGVWHLANNGTSTTTDSTSLHNDGAINGATASSTAPIDGGYTFNSASLNNITGAISNTVFPITVSGFGSHSSGFGSLFSHSNGSNQGFRVTLDTGPVLNITLGGINGWDFTNLKGVYNQSYYFAVTVNGSTVPTGYMATSTGVGALVSQTLGGIGGPIGTQNQWSMGRRGDNGDPLNGIMDEVRFSKIARSAAWIQTEYATEVSPNTFYSVGPEENVPAASTVFPEAVIQGNVNIQGNAHIR